MMLGDARAKLGEENCERYWMIGAEALGLPDGLLHKQTSGLSPAKQRVLLHGLLSASTYYYATNPGTALMLAIRGKEAGFRMMGEMNEEYPAHHEGSDSLGAPLHLVWLVHRIMLFNKRIIELGLNRRTASPEDLREDDKMLSKHLSASVEDFELVQLRQFINAVRQMKTALTELDSATEIALPIISSVPPTPPPSADSEDQLGGDSHVRLSTEEPRTDLIIPRRTTRLPHDNILRPRLRTLLSQVSWTTAQLYELEGKILDLRSDPSSPIFDATLASDEAAMRRKQQEALDSYRQALTYASTSRQDGPREGVLASDWKSLKEKRMVMEVKVDAGHKTQETER